MHSLLIIMEGRENAIGLNFRTHDAADKARERIISVGATTDDFGHHIVVRKESVIATIIADVEREHEAHGELALSQARAQAAAQAKANADPKMRFLTGQAQHGRLVG